MVALTIYLSEELLRRLDALRFEREERTMQPVLRAALEAFVAEFDADGGGEKRTKEDRPHWNRAHRKLMQELEQILNSGTKQQIQTVTNIIQNYAGLALPGEVAAVRRKSGN